MSSIRRLISSRMNAAHSTGPAIALTTAPSRIPSHCAAQQKNAPSKPLYLFQMWTGGAEGSFQSISFPDSLFHHAPDGVEEHSSPVR